MSINTTETILKKTGVILYKDSMYEIVSESVHTQTEELS